MRSLSGYNLVLLSRRAHSSPHPPLKKKNSFIMALLPPYNLAKILKFVSVEVAHLCSVEIGLDFPTLSDTLIPITNVVAKAYELDVLSA